MAKVFISYARGGDGERLAGLLDDRLREARQEVFVDRRIELGSKWADEIERALRAADYLVILLCERAFRNEWIPAEIDTAIEAGAVLLPVIVGNPASLPLRLRARLDAIHFARWRSQADDAELVRQIMAVVTGAGALAAAAGPAAAERSEAPPPAEAPPDAPVPQSEPPSLEHPRGSMAPTSRFYVVRAADELLDAAIATREPLAVVRGSRQTGKTSLLARQYYAASKRDETVAFIDFQSFGHAELDGLDVLLRHIADTLHGVIRGADDPAPLFTGRRGGKMSFSRYIEDLLRHTPRLVLMFDEVDRVIDRDYRDDLFGLFRYWSNRARWEPAFSRLTTVLAHSTEPHLLITDLNQSPFNIGISIDLDDFDHAQVERLNRLHGTPLGAAKIAPFMDLVGGHPYLVRQALYHMAAHRLSWPALDAVAAEDAGPFSDHLKRCLLGLLRVPALRKAMLQILKTGSCTDEDSLFRLNAAGYVRGRSAARAGPRCGLYRRFLEPRL